MKVNEVTEGFLGYLGGAVADKLGARQTANALRLGFGKVVNDQPDLFKDPEKVQRILNLLTQVQNARGSRLTDGEVVSILSKRLPTAWNAEGNRNSVLKGVMDALSASPITTKPTLPGKPVKAKTAVSPDQASANAASASDMEALRARLQAKKAQFQRR